MVFHRRRPASALRHTTEAMYALPLFRKTSQDTDLWVLVRHGGRGRAAQQFARKDFEEIIKIRLLIEEAAAGGGA